MADPSIFGRLGWVRVRLRLRLRVGVSARPGLEPSRTTSSPSASAWRNASSLVSGAGALRASWGLDLPGFRPRPRPVVSATSSESTCAPCSTCSGTAAAPSCEAVGCADVNGSAAGGRRRSALAGGVGTKGHGGSVAQGSQCSHRKAGRARGASSGRFGCPSWRQRPSCVLSDRSASAFGPCTPRALKRWIAPRSRAVLAAVLPRCGRRVPQKTRHNLGV